MVKNTDGHLKSYKRFQTRFSREEFAKRFSHPFLVLDKDKGSGQKAKLSYETMCMQPHELEGLMNQSLSTASSSNVTKVVNKGSKVFVGRVNVGRTSNCDVVIDSPLVSKFHAYFTKDIKSGSYCLSDAKSTNGTHVNKVKLRPEEKKILSNGDTLLFGRQVTFSYYTPEGFHDLLAQISD